MINYSSRFAARGGVGLGGCGGGGGGFVKIDYLNKINGYYRGVQTHKKFP
jgi:hypothetical protein